MEDDKKKKEKKKKVDYFFDVKDILEKDKIIVPVSPKLDIGLNGGVPEGSWVIVSGKAKLGKSTLALTIAKNAQKLGKKVYYFDIENRIKKTSLEGIEGLDLSEEKFQLIRSKQNNIISAEENLEIAENLLKTEPNLVVIIDSASSLCSAGEYDAEITSQARNPGPKLLSTFTRKLAAVVPVQDSIVIIIQHLIANTSGYGPAMMEDGGNKIQYQCDVKLRGRGFSKWEDGEKQIGQNITWDVVYSALGSPGATVESYLRYGSGIDEIWESIELGCDLGLIIKGGAWFTLDYLPTADKVQGQKKVWELLKNNPKYYEDLKAKIKSFYA